MPDTDGLRAQFEHDGVPTIRARLGEFQGWVKAEAIKWLAHKDFEERLRNDASQSLQIAIARSAKRAAWIAAVAAIIAAVAAIITIVLMLIGK